MGLLDTLSVWQSPGIDYELVGNFLVQPDEGLLEPEMSERLRCRLARLYRVTERFRDSYGCALAEKRLVVTGSGSPETPIHALDRPVGQRVPVLSGRA